MFANLPYLMVLLASSNGPFLKDGKYLAYQTFKVQAPSIAMGLQSVPNGRRISLMMLAMERNRLVSEIVENGV